MHFKSSVLQSGLRINQAQIERTYQHRACAFSRSKPKTRTEISTRPSFLILFGMFVRVFFFSGDGRFASVIRCLLFDRYFVFTFNRFSIRTFSVVFVFFLDGGRGFF